MSTALDSTLGIAQESTYGAAVTVARFWEGAETFDKKLGDAKGRGLRPNSRGTRLNRHVIQKTDVAGDTDFDIVTRGLGILFGAFFGSVSNTAVPGATPAVYQQVHTPSTTDPLASFTIQKGVPPVGGGTVVPITMTGCMADQLDIDVKNTGILTAKIGWIGQDAVRSIGYAAPSYPADLGPYDNVHVSLQLGGTLTAPTTTALASSTQAAATNLADFSASMKNNLDSEGFNLGSAGKRSRKNMVQKFEATGKITAEFTDTTLLDAYWNQTSLPLIMTATHDQEIDTATHLHSALQLVFPAVRLKGETPKIGDGSPVKQSIDWESFEDGTNRPAYLVYRTLDTLP